MVASRRSGEAGRRSTRGAGFSFVELLVASLLLVTIVLGIIPLFMRSIINNTAGNDYTQLSNYSKSEVEEMFQLDFNHGDLTIPNGQTEFSIDEYWDVDQKKWILGPVPGGTFSPWTRTTTVRQYHSSATDKDLNTRDFLISSALDGGAVAETVQLKEIHVTVRGERGGPLGPRRNIVLRTLKAK
jgi:hypothetical protein